MPVDADSDFHELTTVLVPYVDAVLSGVFGGDFVNDEAGKLATVKRDPGVLSGSDFLLVLEPGDLRSRLAPHGAGEAQGLERTNSQLKSKYSQNTTHSLGLLHSYTKIYLFMCLLS